VLKYKLTVFLPFKTVSPTLSSLKLINSQRQIAITLTQGPCPCSSFPVWDLYIYVGELLLPGSAAVF